jgi:L,D-peptidoglycan transpeptidase YkuD (ErfK/YbiS/YcfS/YnhG family)
MESFDSQKPRARTKRSPTAKPWLSRRINRLIVSKAYGPPWSGRLQAGQVTLSCALGQTGIRNAKREGDRATPRGTFGLLSCLWREDHVARLNTLLPQKAIARQDGWCDDSTSPAYNRAVTLPFSGGHERLHRNDSLYDVVIVLDHNQRPRIRGHGSAIFFHLARPGYGPTEGCVAISRNDMRRLLPRLGRHVRMQIG